MTIEKHIGGKKFIAKFFSVLFLQTLCEVLIPASLQSLPDKWVCKNHSYNMYMTQACSYTHTHTHMDSALTTPVGDISLSPVIYSLIEEIVVFSHNIVEWVFNALQDLPAALGIRKVQSE